MPIPTVPPDKQVQRATPLCAVRTCSGCVERGTVHEVQGQQQCTQEDGTRWQTLAVGQQRPLLDLTLWTALSTSVAYPHTVHCTCIATLDCTPIHCTAGSYRTQPALSAARATATQNASCSAQRLLKVTLPGTNTHCLSITGCYRLHIASHFCAIHSTFHARSRFLSLSFYPAAMSSTLLPTLTSHALRQRNPGSSRVRGALYLQDIIHTKLPLNNLRKLDIHFGGVVKAASTK